MEDLISEENIDKMTADHLMSLASLTSYPAAARFYMFSREKHGNGIPDLEKNRKHYCHHCCSKWSEEKYRVRVHPREAENTHLRKLKQIEEKQPWRLNKHQKKRLNKWHESVNKIVYTCNICNKQTVFPGIKKQVLITTTPASKKKQRKKDLNAGLFFSPEINKMNTPEETRSISDETQMTEELLTNEGIDQNGIKTPVLLKLFNSSLSKSGSKSKNSLRNHITPGKLKTPDSTISITQGQSSGKRKKKTLLAQILNEEQSAKKKTSLASFLVSL